MDRTQQTRRRVLKLTGAATATALVAGCGGPGEEENAPEDEPAEDPAGGDGTAGEEEPGGGAPESEEGTGNGQDMEDDEGM